MSTLFSSTTLRLAAVAATASALAACSLLPEAEDAFALEQSLTNEVATAKALRTELESSLASIEGRVAAVERDVRALPDVDIVVDPEVVDPEAVERAAESVESDLEGAGDGAQSGAERALGSLEGAAGDMEEEMARKRAEIDRLALELKSGIPDAMAALVKTAATVAPEMAALQQAADGEVKVAAKNPMMDSDEMAELRLQRQALDQEVEQTIASATMMAEKSEALSARLATIAEEFDRRAGAETATRR